MKERNVTPQSALFKLMRMGERQFPVFFKCV